MEYRDFIDDKANEIITGLGGTITPAPANPELYRDFLERKFDDVINALPSGPSSEHHYSTTEQIVGTWIDGSPVYEKSFSVTSPVANVPTNIIEITSLSVDDVVSLEGVINAVSNAIYIGNTDWRMWTRMNWESTNKDYIACNITNPAYAVQPLVVTIRYTKSST